MSPDTAANSQPIHSGAIWALSLAAFGSAASLRITDALLPRLASEFSVSLGDASYAVTCFSFAYGIAQLFFGPVGDRFGKYRVVAWACCACAVTAGLCALAPSLSTLLIARLLAGTTAAAIVPLSMAWIGDVVPYHLRQPILARFLIGQIFGIAAGALVGGYTAEYLDWRAPFVGLSITFILISLLLHGVHRGLPAHARKMYRADGPAIQRMVNEFRQIIALPWARVVLLTVFLEGVFLFGAFAFIASHLNQQHAVPLSLAGALVMLYGAGGLLFAVTAGTLVKKLGEVGLSKWGGILICLSLAMIGLSPSWHWAVPGCFFAGLGYYMLHNTLQINATQMAPDRRGAAVSAFASCFFIGQSVGVAMVGALVGFTGTGFVLVAGAIGVIIVALRFSLLRAAVPA